MRKQLLTLLSLVLLLAACSKNNEEIGQPKEPGAVYFKVTGITKDGKEVDSKVFTHKK